MKDVAQIIMRHGIARQQLRRLLQRCQAVLALYLKGRAQYLPGEPGIRVSPGQRARLAFQFRVMSAAIQGNQLIAFGWCRRMRSGPILAAFLVFLSAAAGARVVTSWLSHNTKLVNGMVCCRASWESSEKARQIVSPLRHQNPRAAPRKRKKQGRPKSPLFVTSTALAVV